MKAVILIISLLINAQAAFASTGNTVENLLPNIRDRVRQCTVLKYNYTKNHVRNEHALISHCPEVKVIANESTSAVAKIRVSGHQFIATLIETQYSDGDFYDVEIRDLVSKDSYRIYNTLAYGDILLGVLEGNTHGVTTSLVNE